MWSWERRNVRRWADITRVTSSLAAARAFRTRNKATAAWHVTDFWARGLIVASFMFALRAHVRLPTWQHDSSVVISHGRSRLVRPNMLPHAAARWINRSTLFVRARTPAYNLHAWTTYFDDSSLWLSCSDIALHPTTCSRQAEVIGILAVCTYAAETWTHATMDSRHACSNVDNTHDTHLRRCLLWIKELND